MIVVEGKDLINIVLQVISYKYISCVTLTLILSPVCSKHVLISGCTTAGLFMSVFSRRATLINAADIIH